MEEPTLEEIKEIIKEQEEKDRARDVKEYRSSKYVKREQEQEVSFPVSNINDPLDYLPMRPRDVRIKFGSINIIPQVELYQLPILGILEEEPIVLLYTDMEYIYMPIGKTGQYGVYTHYLKFVELGRYRPMSKSYVSVLKDTNNRIIKHQEK